ncbi:MAG: MFS transporter [Candidatus Lokiarchaeota archaeon]|nr:MFS transporter [Candidatus Lokiarchaeota archaeon]
MSEELPDNRLGVVSRKKIFGYAMLTPATTMLFMMWGNLQFFATSVLFIPQIIVTFIFLIYSLVDAFNDPLIGYFTDRSKKFTARFGKRFFWILIGGLVGPLFLILSFVQTGDISAVMTNAIWLMLMMVVYESFLTLLEVSHASLYPDLFREDSSRRKAGAIGAMIGGGVQIIFSFISPILLAIFGGALSQPAYLTRTIVFVILAYLIFIPYIRSIRESKERKEFRVELDRTGKAYSPFKEVLKNMFKDKIWVGLVFSYLLWGTAGACMLYGMNYFLIYYLDLPIEYGAIPSLGYGVITVVFTPIWTTIAKKIGVRKTYLISLALHNLIYVMFFFVTSYPGLLIVTTLAGIPTASNFGVIATLARAEAIDNSVIKTNKREEGSYLGILRVFTAFTYFFQVALFTIVGVITGFEASVIPATDPVVKQGLNLQMSLVPLVLNILATLILYFTYTITKEQGLANKNRLKELGL